MQHDVGALRSSGDLGVVVRIYFSDVRARRRMRRSPWAHEAGDPPARSMKGLGGGFAEASSGAKNQDV
jgi:hypothetical protein